MLPSSSSGRMLIGREGTTNTKELYMKTMVTTGTLEIVCQLVESTIVTSRQNTIIIKTRNRNTNLLPRKLGFFQIKNQRKDKLMM
jgi:hypothetical protein